MLVARLYERCLDREPALPEAKRARRLQPPTLGVEIDFSLPASRVVQVLTRLVNCHGCPAQLRADNGPEFISAWLSEWCEQQGIMLHLI
jgi:hypothetical protein